MTSWMPIIDIGHTAVMIPTAGAILAWLLLGRTWKLAVWWSLILATGLCVVAWSKMAFLGWGWEIRSVGFQALSGHAWRATAILPVFFFLIPHYTVQAWRIRGALFGAALGIALDILLVTLEFHTASEVIASTVLGFCAAFAFIRRAFVSPPLKITPWTAPVTLFAFIAICSLKPSALNHHLVDLALYVSGRDQPYRWSRQIDPSVPHATSRKSLTTCQVSDFR